MSILDAVRAEVPRALDDLRTLVAVPSVSSEPQRAAELRRSADLAAELYRREGVTAEVVGGDGFAPAVVGRKSGPPGAPTVLLYAHHDVQPAGAGWTTDPFTLVQRGDRLYGRGSSDDKGGIALHLAVLRAYGDQLPVNVVVLVEGEEEIGSPGLATLLDEHLTGFPIDVTVIPDAINAALEVPSLTTELRGIADLVVTVETLVRPVHSGLYGGALPCALTTLVRLLGTLHDAHGDVAVAGLHADPPSERATLTDTAELLLPGVTETGTGSLADRVVARHSVTVLAIDTTSVADAANVLHARASAKLGIRVPPQASPEEAMRAVRAHLESHVPDGARLSISPGVTGSGFRMTEGPVRDIVEDVLSEVYGARCVSLGVGGSIPFVAALTAAHPETALAVTAVQDPDSAAHSADESLSIPTFERACVAHALLLERLAAADLS